MTFKILIKLCSNILMESVFSENNKNLKSLSFKIDAALGIGITHSHIMLLYTVCIRTITVTARSKVGKQAKQWVHLAVTSSSRREECSFPFLDCSTDRR
jgi:hypothetical protein